VASINRPPAERRRMSLLPNNNVLGPVGGDWGCLSSGKLRRVVGNSLQTVDRVVAARHHPRVQHNNSDLCCAWTSSTRPRPWFEGWWVGVDRLNPSSSWPEARWRASSGRRTRRRWRVIPFVRGRTRPWATITTKNSNSQKICRGVTSNSSS